MREAKGSPVSPKNSLVRPVDLIRGLKLRYLLHSPFKVFEYSPFLSTAMSESLNREFPWNHVLKNAPLNASRAEIDMSGDYDLFRRVTSELPTTRSLIRSLSSQAFLRYIEKSFRVELQQRLTDRNPLIRQLARYLPGVLLEVKATFTVYGRGFHLTPHTDGVKKFLALIVYFEDPSAEPAEKRAAQRTGGTGFWIPLRRDSQTYWKSRLRPNSVDQIDSLALPRDQDGIAYRSLVAEFAEDFRREVVSEARNNSAVGFIKNNESWHDVDLREYPVGLRRGAILVNVNLENFSVRRLLRNFLAWYLWG